ncbi:SRPBCC family protein [Nocardia sp. NPDC059180]|uniref:SRPBCC family protein n=1 Tax=Nocardia sp. NPDC059180 TaxID=3346761 RepID=UPI003688AA32
MIEVREQCELGSDADTVWKQIRDFPGFVEMLVESRDGARVEPSGEGIGMLRTVTLGADTVVERLEELDDSARRTSYSMPVTGPFPIAGYLATITLAPLGGNRCALTWSGRFEPAGVAEEIAAAAVREVYTAGIDVLRVRFGS